MEHHTTLKAILDVLSYITAVSVLSGVLPPIAATMSIVWIGVQLYDRVKYGPKQKPKE